MEEATGLLWMGCSSGEEACLGEEDREDGYCNLPDPLLSLEVLEQEATTKRPNKDNTINFFMI
jgi:hypothetical protein